LAECDLTKPPPATTFRGFQSLEPKGNLGKYKKTWEIEASLLAIFPFSGIGLAFIADGQVR
jgi:hypothetical protein